jgi:hypothetical protein
MVKLNSQSFAFALLVCLFTFLAVMGLQSTRTVRTMPDREYIALKARGEYPAVGVVSETQNTVTLYCSFGLIGVSIFLAVLTVMALLRAS